MSKNKLANLLLILVFLIGLSLMLYPTASDYWNSLHSSRVMNTYAEEIAHMDNNRYEAVFQEAREYNAGILERKNVFYMSEEDLAEYREQLGFALNGVMASVEIPTIDVSLPIYHGTDESILQTGIGHVEWTSLPVGGESTHCVISGHRGLPSAKLFTNLDKLKEGDLFLIRVLDETLTYEVDQIHIVLPHETEKLLIEEGEDLCTLVTCTPYGINSHRLLVRGHRVENQAVAKAVRVTADATQIDPLIMAPLVAAPMLLLLLLWLLIPTKKKR